MSTWSFLSRFLPAWNTASSSGSPNPLVMDNPLRAPRTRTVEELARILDQEGVIHVRGTPASGKSVLAKLLYQHYRKRETPVLLFEAWPIGRDDNYQQILVDRAHSLGYDFINRDTIKDARYVLILDEGQMTYHNRGLWFGLIKSQSGQKFGPRICIFTSYGSPTGGPSDSTVGSPLAYLGAQQRVSILPSAIEYSPQIALFFDREEYDDMVQRFCHVNRLRLDDTARAYIFNLTNGQPGAIDSILKLLLHVYHARLKHEQLTLNDIHVMKSLDKEGKGFKFLFLTPVARSFPKRNPPIEAARTLRRVLVEGSVDRDLSDKGIKLCYERGWLHSEPVDYWADRILCVFPTQLHAKFVEHYLTSTTIEFPLDKYPDITALAISVLKRFSSRNLSHATRYGPGAMIRPVEASYQDEFYRAAHEVLGYTMNICNEWSSDGIGRINFRFAQVGWGIELLREGDRLKEHCERFNPGGTYDNWIQEGSIQDWLIMDCRTTAPTSYHIPSAKLWRAVFATDFSSVEVLDATNRVLFSRFSLMA